MKFSENWLRSLCNPDLDTRQLEHLVTMAGLEVEAVEPAAPPFSKVVVAEILSAERHPNADRLQVCKVRVGEGEPLQIVCGAPNARAGLKTACALVGAELPNDFKIRQAKVRGVESFGMLCSAKELGLMDAAEGILELPADAPVGEDFRAWRRLDDNLLTLKLTPNRGDCLSVLGIAREVAALTGAPLNHIDCSAVAAGIADTFPVSVDAPGACPRYCGRVIRGIDARAQTPAWMLERLERSGLRAIHPVVDVTNYVLLELGQPMHAFDLARLKGGIHVRMGRPGEKLELLNGQTIELAPDTLAIADDNGALALAGIMGGAASAVSEATHDIFLESAHFAPGAIAGRARRYGLATDSSHRFERGVDIDLPRHALERATRLILDICGGQAGPLAETVAAEPPRRAAVLFRPERARRLLGIDLPEAEMRSIFSRLGMQLAVEGEALRVTPPGFRFDIEREVDLIEEIARVHGYDAIPSLAPRAEARLLPVSESSREAGEVKRLLAARGYQEIITYSFIASELDADFRLGGQPLALVNPIASQMDTLRSSLMAGLVQTLRHNLNHGQERLRLFELGRCFDGADVEAQPLRLAGLVYGTARPEQWGEAKREADFFDVRSDLEAMFHPLAVDFERAEHPALHPGRSARIRWEGQGIGWLGTLHPRLVQKYDLVRPPILFELEWSAVAVRRPTRYAGLSRFPAVRRDIALLADAELAVGEMLAAARANLPPRMVAISLFDVYQGKGLEPGKKSLAFSMLLQDTEKTLTDAEIEAAVDQMVQFLAQRFQTRLRAA
ncbi:MAG: phenylalanine--tRNA ligase subunit beta [Pseudomonadota bacterium]